jgi:hypothetical protein
MKNSLVLAGLLLILPIAGCHGDFLSNPFSPYGNASPDTPRGRCERAAYNDPVVKDMLAKEAGGGSMPEYWVQKVEDAKRAAVHGAERRVRCGGRRRTAQTMSGPARHPIGHHGGVSVAARFPASGPLGIRCEACPTSPCCGTLRCPIRSPDTLSPQSGRCSP